MGVLEAGGGVLDPVLDYRRGGLSRDLAGKDVPYNPGGTFEIGGGFNAWMVDSVESKDMEDVCPKIMLA